jgi:uncharacterized membrane protein
MTPASLAADLAVAVVGALICATPLATRPTLQFGVRVPAQQASAPVVRGQRRAYYWRTAAIAVCCTVVALSLHGHGSWWLARVILLAEIATDIGCFWIARRNIAAARDAGHWLTGVRQAIVADTGWRTDPPRFPVAWLMPALAVIAATAVTGALRYPGLPARIATGFGGPGHSAPRSVVTVFSVVAGQLYVTALWTGLLLTIYRSRPDIEVADVAASALRSAASWPQKPGPC